ncbi:MAG TPA: YoaK family protein [Streptosporangiaceae bacterium]|nr:YoaK family protein [Streptosporangiaceae bacterium]
MSTPAAEPDSRGSGPAGAINATLTRFVADVMDTVRPDAAGKHGPLPPLLVSMTMVTGLVDAFSYLVLGHVFVANMTGNVVFLGFALAGAPGFSITASLTAMAAFATGALAGGRLGARHRAHRGKLHSSAAAVQAAFLAASVILAVAGSSAPPAGYRYSLIAVLGIAMGIQNATARTIAVPDLTTTVLTLTITGIAADSALAGGPGSKAGRRLVPIATMLVGALIGAVLVRHAQTYDPLVVALVTISVGAAVSRLLGRTDPDWVRPLPS